MKSRTLYRQVLLTVAVFLPMQVAAYTVTPSIVMLRSSGDGSSTFLQLANKELQAAAIEVTVQEHRKDLAGQTIEGREANDDFIIYPSQLVMVPGDEVSVQVRWAGDPKLTVERVYTVVTRQVPIPPQSAEEADSGDGIRLNVRVLLNYEVRVYVTPPGAKPKAVVESVTERPAPPEDGSSPVGSGQLEIVLVNQGTAHQSLRAHSLIFVPLDPAGLPLKQPVVTVAAKDVPGLTPHLLAGDRRRLLIPRPAGLPAGPVRVSLSE